MDPAINQKPRMKMALNLNNPEERRVWADDYGVDVEALDARYLEMLDRMYATEDLSEQFDIVVAWSQAEAERLKVHAIPKNSPGWRKLVTAWKAFGHDLIG